VVLTLAVTAAAGASVISRKKKNKASGRIVRVSFKNSVRERLAQSPQASATSQACKRFYVARPRKVLFRLRFKKIDENLVLPTTVSASASITAQKSTGARQGL
jgi:hypothetical protein